MKKNRLPQILSRIVGTKFFLILCAALSFSIVSCDEASVVGLDVQPSTDLLNVKYTDTVTFVTQTVREDSLKTDESVIITGVSLLGKYIDPGFGTTSSSIYTSLKRSTTIASTTFGTNPIIDSVVFALVYDTTCYGKKERKTQTVDVYQLTETMPLSKEYASTHTVAFNPLALASKNFIPRPKDSVVVDGKNAVPQLRIRLNNNFGQTILNNQSTGNLKDDDAVQNFIKGFYITTENSVLSNVGDGNIMLFKMADAQTKLTVYYHNNAANALKYDFVFSGVSRFIHFNHNYLGANVDALLSSQLANATIQQNNTVFVQSMAGVKVKMLMPYIKSLNDSGLVSINKAELVIKVDQNPLYQLDTFAAPNSLLLFGINDDGTNYILPDALEGSNYYGGTYNKDTKEYRYNIARYIQQIVSGKRKNNGLYILAQGGAVNANRVVIGGGRGANQIKLNITYTKIH